MTATATAGTGAAGLTLLARDWVHHRAGRVAVLACLTAGAVISAGLAGPRPAVASAVAFAVSELADLLVYPRLTRRPGWLIAAAVSNAVGAPVDTVLFLAVAGLPIGVAGARPALGQDARHNPAPSPSSPWPVRLLRHRRRPRVRDALRAGQLGMITTPAADNKVPPDVPRCADNSYFTPGRYPGDDAYLRRLAHRAQYAARCVFATAPDLVGDAAGTLHPSAPVLPEIRATGRVQRCPTARTSEVIAALHAPPHRRPAWHDEVLRRELRTVTGLSTAQVASALDY